MDKLNINSKNIIGFVDLDPNSILEISKLIGDVIKNQNDKIINTNLVFIFILFLGIIKSKIILNRILYIILIIIIYDFNLKLIKKKYNN